VPGDVLEGSHHVVLFDELDQGSKPKRLGHSGRERFLLMEVTMSVPRTLAKRRVLTTTSGFSSAKSRTSPSASTSARSTWVLGGNERGVSSENVFGSFSVAP